MMGPPSEFGAVQTTVSVVGTPPTDVIVGAPGLLCWATIVTAISEMQNAMRVAAMVRAFTVSPPLVPKWGWSVSSSSCAAS